MEIITDVSCPHCGEKVVVQLSATVRHRSGGQAWASLADENVTSYAVEDIFCSNESCATSFKMVPGQPKLATELAQYHTDEANQRDDPGKRFAARMRALREAGELG